MEESESDEEMFITQNSFRESSTLDVGFDISSLLKPEDRLLIDKVLGVEENEVGLLERNDLDEEPEQFGEQRQVVVISDEELRKRNETRIPVNTKASTSWTVNVWTEWAIERNWKSKDVCSTDKYTTVNCDLLELHDDELNYWLSKFVGEVRQKKEPGRCCTPNSLYQMCCGIQRYLRDNGKPGLNLFENPSVKLFQDSLDAELKSLTRKGVGSEVKQAQAFTEEQEERLWRVGALGDDAADVLLDTMVFLIGKNFALRSGQEHRELKFNQLRLEIATKEEPEKLVFQSFGEKNNAGGLKHRGIKAKVVEHYRNEEIPAGRCLVELYKKYVSKCPKGALEKESFYLTPKRKYDSSDEGS